MHNRILHLYKHRPDTEDVEVSGEGLETYGMNTLHCNVWDVVDLLGVTVPQLERGIDVKVEVSQVW